MPTRPLTEAERQGFARFGDAPSLDQLARYFHLDETDRTLITGLRGSLGLVLNAIIHWNAIYMQEALRQLRENGAPVHPADVAKLSPLLWRHINVLGRYEFALPDAVAKGGLRPLRNPTSEWDF